MTGLDLAALAVALGVPAWLIVSGEVSRRRSERRADELRLRVLQEQEREGRLNEYGRKQLDELRRKGEAA